MTNHHHHHDYYSSDAMQGVEQTMLSPDSFERAVTNIDLHADEGITLNHNTVVLPFRTYPTSNTLVCIPLSSQDRRPDHSHSLPSYPKPDPDAPQLQLSLQPNDSSNEPISPNACPCTFRLQLSRKPTSIHLKNMFPNTPTEFAIQHQPSALIGGTLLAQGEKLVEADVPSGNRFAGRGPHIYDRIKHYHGDSVIVSELSVKKAAQFAKEMERLDENARMERGEEMRCLRCAAHRLECSWREEKVEMVAGGVMNRDKGKRCCKQCSESGNGEACELQPEGYYHYTRDVKVPLRNYNKA
jgi:hypothetical protein